MKPAPVSRSGRFAGRPAADLVRFTESVSFDCRLWRQDIEGSLAHAAMLRAIRVLKTPELRAIERGLVAIGREIQHGRFVWQVALEDVHMNIEAALTRRVPAGAKLHTGRSRNDQVALDLRLWLREEIMRLTAATVGLEQALVDLGARYPRVVIPGYTHLQRAQPLWLAHHLLAYVEMLERDRQRLADCARRVNFCPLGSGALAGSTLPLRRELVARRLGFLADYGQASLTGNSLDAVADRDFVVEFCAVAALLAVHLSRLAEDLILWSTTEFGFLRLADAYTTGSSLMPQKRNPDVAELARGKTGRVVGNLVALLTMLKGLPMSYNRDLQEDKERLFDTADTVRATVGVLAAALRSAKVNEKACAKAAGDPALLATDLADYLVRRRVPFREAHHAVGAVVALAERLGHRLDCLSVADLRSVHRAFGKDARAVFDLERALGSRRQPGAPDGLLVGEQLRRWQRALGRAGRESSRQLARIEARVVKQFGRPAPA